MKSDIHDHDTRPDPQAQQRVLVIVPALNEEGSIGSVITEILALGSRFVPVVIDDGSTDNTRARARGLGVRVVSLSMNLGIGGAVQTGIQIALGEGYGLCCQVDADGQHAASDLPVLLDRMREQRCNIVVGSRFMGTASGDRSTRMRRAGSRIISKNIAAAFGGARVSDPTSGLRLMDRRAMTLFARDYPHDYPEPISLAAALRDGLAVEEAPVAMRARAHGRSSIGGFGSVLYMFRVVCYIWLVRVRVHSGSKHQEGETR